MNLGKFGLHQIAHMRAGLTFITLDYQQFADFWKRKSQSLSATNEFGFAECPGC